MRRDDSVINGRLLRRLHRNRPMHIVRRSTGNRVCVGRYGVPFQIDQQPDCEIALTLTQFAMREKPASAPFDPKSRNHPRRKGYEITR